MRRRVAVATLVAGVVLSACTGGADPPAGGASPAQTPTPESASPAPPPSPDPEPTRPPKPAAEDGRLEGVYLVRFYTITTNVEGAEEDNEPVEWTFTARCREGGGCNAKIASANGWHANAFWRNGKYRWTRDAERAFTCNGEPIPASYEYVISGDRVSWDGEEWVISRFTGTFESRARGACGFVGVPEIRESIRGTLLT